MSTKGSSDSAKAPQGGLPPRLVTWVFDEERDLWLRERTRASVAILASRYDIASAAALGFDPKHSLTGGDIASAADLDFD